MAKKVKFELNMRGLNELMKSGEMQQALNAAGEKVAQIAGDGYEHRTHVADFTAITNVYPNTAKAAHDNYENNTLLKATVSAGLPQEKP